MKKIISALTISALALGSIFADVSLEYTQKGYISSNENNTSKKLDLNGYSEKITGDVAFTLSNENAGVAFVVTPYYKDEGRTGSLQDDTDFFDQYYGWVNFFGGKMKLQSGVWKTRSVNRLNQDAGVWEDNEYEMCHYGIVGSKIGQDITRLASINGKKALSTALTFHTDSFYATGAIITNNFKTSGTTSTKSGFALETGLNLDENTKVQAILKTPEDQKIAFGLFLDKSKITIKDRTFDIVAGVTIASDFGTAGAKATNPEDTSSSVTLNKGFEAAVDLRLRYELSDSVAITSMNNVSYLGTKTASNGENGVFNVWDMVSVALKATDTIKVQVTGEWVYQDLSVGHNGYFSVTPGVVVTPMKDISITSGLIIRTYGWSKPTDTSFAIPFILHVAL